MVNAKGKIECMVGHVTKVIDEFRNKQIDPLRKNQQSTQNNNAELFDEHMMDKFIIAMDNYFTRPKVIKYLRDNNIGVVGTSRITRLWPSKELKDVSNVKFNDFL